MTSAIAQNNVTEEIGRPTQLSLQPYTHLCVGLTQWPFNWP